MNSITTNQIANALGGKKTANGWLCRCPAHEDNSPSLSVADGNGKTLLKCHAGCSSSAVIDALIARGLWGMKGNKAPTEKVEYIYHDLDGSPALRVTRTDLPGGGKRIFQSRFENGTWKPGGAKVDVTPYRFDVWREAFDRWIILTEGEKCADKLAESDFIATTTPGGSKAWRSHYAKHFSGRKVAILPDNDRPGLEYAAAAYRDILPIAKEIKVIDLPGLGEGEDVYDYFTKGGTAAELKRLITESKSLPARFAALLNSPQEIKPEYEDESKLTPLKGKIKRLPLAPEAFHGLAGEFVKLVEPTTESDAVAVLTQFLAAFGNSIGRTAHVQIGAAKHYANLFVALVGDSSVGRKGTAWELVALIMSKVDEKWWNECRIFGLGSGEGLVSSVKDYEVPTAEELKRKPSMKIEKPRDKRGMVIEGEFGLTLKVFQREGGTLSPQVRNAWDSGDLRVTTKENSLKATGAHISIIGHITSTELKQLLSMSDIFNGVGNRFLWICTTRSKLVPIPRLPSEELINKLIAGVKDAKEYAELQARLSLDDEALAAYCAIYSDLAKERPGLIGALTARAAPLIQRLAMIYALLDRSNVITLTHLKAALAVWEYAERSIHEIFGDQTGDRHADRILEALESAPNGLTQTEIIVDVFGRNLAKQKIAAALAILEKFNLAASTIERVEGSKRQVVRWRVTRTNYEFNELYESTNNESSLNSLNSCFVSQEGGLHVS